jgi:RimJ/RimL family protein N-acetyltransferase
VDIIFKNLTEEYLEWVRNLHNDPEVLSMLTDPHVVSYNEQIEWFNKLQKSTTLKRLVVFNNNTPIGIIRVDQKDYYNKSVGVGLDIHKDFRGLGLAKEIYTKLIKELFEDGFNRIWLLVASYNIRALNLYKKLGFVYEGAQREGLYKDGVFYDYLMMSILKKEYLNG